jgi:hypothetical protein
MPQLLSSRPFQPTVAQKIKIQNEKFKIAIQKSKFLVLLYRNFEFCSVTLHFAFLILSFLTSPPVSPSPSFDKLRTVSEVEP